MSEAGTECLQRFIAILIHRIVPDQARARSRFNIGQCLLHPPAAFFQAIGKFHPEPGELSPVERGNYSIKILPYRFLFCFRGTGGKFL